MPKKVLVVENNKIERQMLLKILSDCYTVIEVASGTDAINILQGEASTISAILLDILMPELDGYAVLELVREHPVWSQIPVIVCTALTDDEAADKALLLGAYAVTTKPYSAVRLHSILRNSINMRETAALANETRKDKLTGLFNREGFFQESEQMINAKEPGFYILSCFDIESFKVINDQYGTEAGDTVLRHVAACITESTLSLDGICCRIMGDKFAALYPAACIDRTEVTALSDKLANVSGIDRHITIRIGRYLVNDLTLPLNAMYDRAAMAEESVKGRYDKHIAQYNDQMRNNLLQEQQIITLMNDALANEEFIPYFQPQYHHGTGEIIGAEALVRWKRSDGTFIYPNQFIPVFERNGFVYEVDKYMWESAAKTIRKWMDAGKRPIPISVNISRNDIFHPDFFTYITGLVKKYDIPVSMLRLEVTESAFSKEPEQIVKAVKELVAFGFIIEIDDFGSGYSSLNTLKDVPAHVLKLDMRFLTGTEDAEGRGGSIIASVVRMAKWLGMTVIAEGVEEKEQADYLKTIGCLNIQGYYYAKPMPLQEYETLLCKSVATSELQRFDTVDHYNNSAFWNPKSMETLIFNSYIGGASIFEFYQGKAETLRHNDGFVREFGDNYINGKLVSTLRPEESLDEENCKILYDNVKKAIATRAESTCEVSTHLLDGKKNMWIDLRCTVRVLAQTEDCFLCYSVVMNISELRIAERKRLAAGKQLAAIMNNIEGGVSAIQFDCDGKITYAVTNDKYYQLFGYTKEEAEAEGRDVLSFIVPEDREKTMKIVFGTLLRKKQSVVMDYRCQKRDGSIIYVRCNASVAHIDGVGDDVITSVVTDITDNVRLQLKEQEANKKLKIIVDSIPGGFARKQIMPDGRIIPLYYSKSFCKLLGMSVQDIEKLTEHDLLGNIHPADRDRLRSAMRQIVDETVPTMRYRILRGDGSYVNVQVCGSIRISETGEKYLNAYYSDATEQMREEQSERELLDNLSCGAVLYQYDGVALTAVYHNKQYWKLLCKDPMDSAGVQVLETVHPDDRQMLIVRLRAAIQEGSDFMVNLRILSGAAQYCRFQVAGKVASSKDGIYKGYATYSPLD